jgi:hypothetical protein
MFLSLYCTACCHHEESELLQHLARVSAAGVTHADPGGPNMAASIIWQV